MTNESNPYIIYIMSPHPTNAHPLSAEPKEASSHPRKLRIEEMERLLPEVYQEAPKRPITIVLDNIRSMHNVGSLFRTADALRLEQLLLCGITGKPPHVEIHKSALGAEEVVPWHYFEDTLRAVQQLQKTGYEVWALEQAEGSIPLEDFATHANTRTDFHSDTRSETHTALRRKPIAIVLGNEVHGVQQAVIDQCAGAIEIRQYGTKHSMNVSVAGGIVMWVLSELYPL